VGFLAVLMRYLIVAQTVYADIYVVLSKEINIRDVSRSIQNQIARAISEMVGMEVGRVNVHVEDIDYAPALVA
jgi:uncharacterized alkaline shock family protein YloU